jgi:hypothetical protein
MCFLNHFFSLAEEKADNGHEHVHVNGHANVYEEACFF